jgi:hypothetical protein
MPSPAGAKQIGLLRLLVLDVSQMRRHGRFWRQSERAHGTEQGLGGIQVVKEERKPVGPHLSFVIHRLPIVPRLTRYLLSDLSEVEVVSATVDLKFDEMNWFARHNRVDADDSSPVRHR